MSQSLNLFRGAPENYFKRQKAGGALLWLLVSLVGVPLPTGSALADKPVSPVPVVVRIGKPAVAVTLSANVSDAGVVLRAGNTRVPLPLMSVTELRADSIELRSGEAIAIARASDGHAQAAALVVRGANGKSEVLWTGRTDLHGDPGERTADAIETRDRDADGTPDVVVGTYDERIRICGQEHTLLAPRAIHPSEGKLRGVFLQRVDHSAAAAEKLTASKQSPGPTGTAVLHALGAVGASSTSSGSSASFATDSKSDTAWSDAVGSGGRFEFLSLRWQAPQQAIRALALTFAGKVPAAVSLVSEHGARVEVALPADAKAGERLWLVPKTPLTGTCLSLVIDDAPGAESGAHVAVAEVEAYTDFDFSGGRQALVAAMTGDGPHAADAADTLVRANLDVTDELQKAWPGLSAQSKRRALRVVAARVSDDARALALVELGLHDADAEVRGSAREVALAAWPKTSDALARAVTDGAAGGDQAAMELARKAHVDAVGALVHAMESAGGSERPALRDALRVALEQAGDKAVPALATAGKPVALRAVLALALSALPARRSEALGIAEATASEAREFPDRYRLAQAAAALPPSAALDAWLAATAKSAEEWMLRDAALAALARSAAPNATETARAALADPYPRVRATALGVLAASPEGFELLAKASRDDKWFLVRIGALENLPVAPGSDAVLTAALADHTAVVRASAIRNARKLRVATAWSAIEPHVARADEYPEVIGEGVGFAKALCVQSSVTALQAVARRGLVPEAWAPDQELALAALDALVQLGGDAARWAGDQARSPLVPEPVRAAIAKRIAAGTPCQPE